VSPPRDNPPRVRRSQLRAVEQRLSDRDWNIIDTLAAVRLATGQQLDALCFSNLSGRSQAVVRGRVLHRLIRWRVLRGLERAIGGPIGGSTQLVVGLDTVGTILAQERQYAAGLPAHRQAPPGDRFVRHTLATTQVLADLRLKAPQPGQIESFTTEPVCWWPDGLGGVLKPDAYVALSDGRARDHWWIEVDLATESLPTLMRKLLRYIDFTHRGQLGPGKVVPRTLVSVKDDRRLAAVRAASPRLPDPAPQQLVVVRDTDVALAMLSRLQE
jgi:hypothetical protein